MHKIRNMMSILERKMKMSLFADNMIILCFFLSGEYILRAYKFS